MPGEQEHAEQHAFAPDQTEALAWLGVLHDGATITPAVAATLWAVDEETAAGRLAALDQAGALQAQAGGYVLAEQGQAPATRLLLCPPPGVPEAAAAHRTLLDRYHARCRGDRWHTLPDDGYIHEHLAWHMEQAGCPAELHALLQEENDTGCNGWHQVREHLGQVAGFRRDMERAWRLADQEVAAGRFEALGHQVRYALLASSLGSLADDLPPALLAALVRHQIWTQAHGLAAARRIPDGARRAETLCHLAPHLPAALLPALLDAALEIESENERACVLAAVAPRLPASCLVPALTAVRQLAEQQRTPPLVALAGPLLATAPEALLEAVFEMQNAGQRAKALSGVAPLLPAGLLPQALAGVLAIRDERQRVAALAPLLQHLPEVLCRRALAATWRMRDVWARGETFVRLAPHLPPYWRSKALLAALEALPGLNQAEAAQLLADMAAHLPPELEPQALAAAEAQVQARTRAGALVALLPHLSPALRAQAANRALEATWLIRSEMDRAAALARLAPHLPADLLDKALAGVSLLDARARAATLAGLGPFLRGMALEQALAGVRAIRDDAACALALAGLAPALGGQPAAAGQALLTALALRDEKSRAMALAGLAPSLPADLGRAALAEVARIRDVKSRAMALAGMAPSLDPADLPVLVAQARAIEAPDVRADALLSLIPALPGPLQKQTVAEAWTAARAMADEQAFVAMLARILPHLARLPNGGGPVFLDAIAAVAAVDNPGHRAQALASFAPLLPAAFLPQVLAALPADSSRLLELVPPLAGPERQQAVSQVLATARGLPPGARSRLLAALVPHLAVEEMCRALATARLIGDHRALAQVLVAVVPHLPGPPAGDALQAVAGLADTWGRDRALAALVPHLPLPLLERAADLAGPAGAAAMALARRAPEHLPRLLAAVRKTPDAWSRSLAMADLACLQPDVREETLAAARQVADPVQRAQALARLVAHLPAAQQADVAAEALAAVRACPRGWENQVVSTALAHLAPYLPEHLVGEAFALAQDLATPGRWAHLPTVETLVALARRLPETAVRHGLAAAHGIPNVRVRAGCLCAYAVRLAELGNDEEALSAARPIQPVVYQVAALRHLAGHLPLESLRQALAMALDLGRHGGPAMAGLLVRLAELGHPQEAWSLVSEMQGKRSRVAAIAALAPHLPEAQQADAWALALATARQIQPAGDRLRLLGDLARRLPAALLPAAAEASLAAAVGRGEGACASPGAHTPASRRLPLACLAGQMAGLPPGELAACWLRGQQGTRLLHLLGGQPRAVALAELSCLVPVLAALGGEPAVAGLYEAVKHVSAWWP